MGVLRSAAAVKSIQRWNLRNWQRAGSVAGGAHRWSLEGKRGGPGEAGAEQGKEGRERRELMHPVNEASTTCHALGREQSLRHWEKKALRGSWLMISLKENEPWTKGLETCVLTSTLPQTSWGTLSDKSLLSPSHSFLHWKERVLEGETTESSAALKAWVVNGTETATAVLPGLWVVEAGPGPRGWMLRQEAADGEADGSRAQRRLIQGACRWRESERAGGSEPWETSLTREAGRGWGREKLRWGKRQSKTHRGWFHFPWPETVFCVRNTTYSA